MFDYGALHLYIMTRYISRFPQAVTSYDNITKPFSFKVWFLSATAVFLIATLMAVTHGVYTTEDLRHFELVKHEESKTNFFIYSYAKLSEPDPLPWFHKWSTGKMVVFFWSILATFLTLFYISNLRAFMVTAQLEKPLETLEDIAGNGKTVYQFDLAVRQR